MESDMTETADVSGRLTTAITDLETLEDLRFSGDFDPRVLTDFCDAVNRVRKVAWAAQQSVAAQVMGCSAMCPLSLLQSTFALHVSFVAPSTRIWTKKRLTFGGANSPN
jgi:hypothetical protein